MGTYEINFENNIKILTNLFDIISKSCYLLIVERNQ